MEQIICRDEAHQRRLIASRLLEYREEDRNKTIDQLLAGWDLVIDERAFRNQQSSFNSVVGCFQKKLEHPIVRDLNWEELWSYYDVQTLDQYIKAFQKYSKRDAKEYRATLERISVDTGDFDDRVKKHIDKINGDCFEVFGEALLKLGGNNREIGVHDFQPLAHNDRDVGVDGTGIGTNGYPATVQFKFRGDINYVLSANDDHLSNFVVASQNKYGVRFSDVEHMIIITTAKSIANFSINHMLHGKVRVVTRDLLEGMVDGNVPFWDNFRRATGV